MEREREREREREVTSKHLNLKEMKIKTHNRLNINAF